jgi:hypothetical protein
MDIEYTLKLSHDLAADGGYPSATDASHRWIFVGFKNSLEALSRYDIYVNASKIYSQAWVGPESFIYNAGLSQTIREKCPYVYTSFKNAWNKSNDICGVYVDLSGQALNAGARPFKVKIPIKINLHQFLVLSSMRYLPSFCGRWEIELYPNWNNIVVLPVHPRAVMGDRYFSMITAAQWDNPVIVTKQFTQIDQPFYMIDTITDNGAVGVPYTLSGIAQKLTCNDAQATAVMMNLTTFQLRFEVFEGLRQMYAEQPLIIPTNILHYSRFSGQPGSNNVGEGFHATLSQCLENCDSIFILVPNNTSQQTCFYQPYLEQVRMALGEFGIHPAQYVNTYNDSRFVAMALDSLNLETSEITAMNEDVARSLTSPRSCFKLNAGVGADLAVAWNKAEGDASNFFIGISLSQVGFQAGTVSSPNTNIPFIFDATLGIGDKTPAAAGPPAVRPNDLKLETSIICMFLIDAAIMIQVVPNSDIPVVKLTNKSIV